MVNYDDFWKRNSKKELKRLHNNRGNPRDVFLIVCEGEKTEPNYFKSFPAANIEVAVIGTGRTPESLVNETLKIIKNGTKYRKFDQIWCVFDRDDHPLENFNSAIQLAERKGFRVAYSNEAFELWYLLHYDFFDTGIDRHAYIEKLKERLGDYRKNDVEMYDKLAHLQESAIKRAAKLLS